MNRERIEQFVMRYLEATGCHVMEKDNAQVTVKLSPEADKDLMNRSYYWSFVERTGAPPEPMSFRFIFDPEALPKPAAGATGTVKPPAPTSAATPGTPAVPGEAQAGDSILGRYFGFVPPVSTSRVPGDTMTFGSRRLEQLFGVVQSKGRFVRLFEQPKEQHNPFASVGYSTWFGINYKVEFICDMKRDELHSFGIHLGTGQIVERFYDRIKRLDLTPMLPSNIHLQPVALKLETAVETLENYLLDKVKRYDHSWSADAIKRLEEEWRRIDDYFGELLLTIDREKKAEVEEQYRMREQEIDWQYRPRITASVINCGFFHLAEGLRTAIDGNR